MTRPGFMTRLAALARRPLIRFGRDKRGVSAVEFALLLPLMLTIYVAGNEVSQAVTIYRKVSRTGSTLGDLIAQVSSLNKTDMDNIMAAATAVMSPYNASGTAIVAAAVDIDSKGVVKVNWSVANAYGTKWTAGAAPPIPALSSTFTSTAQQLIITKVTYVYTSSFSAIMHDILGADSITLSDIAYLKPRVSDTITYTP